MLTPKPPIDLNRRVTLKDVAQLAGVSPMTVSNVVNGRLKGYTTETHDKVMWAVQATNYRPDIAARSLRTDRRMAVGMLVVQEDELFLSEPYITNLLDGLCAGLNRHGYSMVLQGLPATQVASAPLVRQRLTDGLCLLMSGAIDLQGGLAETLRSLGQPLVLFQQNVEFGLPDGCVLRQDDVSGGRLLSRHLVERGALRIVVIIPQPGWPAMQARLDGIRQEVAEAGGGAEVTVLTSVDESPVATAAALATYLETGEPFDAVIAGNDQMAIAAHRMLTRRGLRVPADVRVAGFNGFSFLDYFEARLTTVQSPAFQLGGLGAEHMIHRVEHGRFATGNVVLPVHLLPGETT